MAAEHGAGPHRPEAAEQVDGEGDEGGGLGHGAPPRRVCLRLITRPWLARPSRDVALLFATRTLRLFAYGFLSVVLVLYLSEAGLSEGRIGLLLSLTLLGDTALSLWITTHADRIGRRRMLLLGAALMILAGVLFAATTSFWVLLLAATIGIISPAGNEVGPVPGHRAGGALPDRSRRASGPQVFAWYALVGSFATALGSLAGGLLSQGLQAARRDRRSRRTAWWCWATRCWARRCSCSSPGSGPSVEAAAVGAQGPQPSFLEPGLGLHGSRKVVFRLSSLFALDAFAGGFVVQSFVAYWFHARFGADEATLGAIFFGANVLAGVSALSAAWLARRFGLVNTMVFTHLPSNLLLVLVPLMPTLPLAIGVLLAALLHLADGRADAPVLHHGGGGAGRALGGGRRHRHRPHRRRLAGAAARPGRSSRCPALASVPFFIAGGLKIVYDLLLWRDFRRVKPEEERGGRSDRRYASTSTVPTLPGSSTARRRSPGASRAHDDHRASPVLQHREGLLELGDHAAGDRAVRHPLARIHRG